MMGLSLWQPWASLMDFAAKKNETRGWPTSYRGDVLICSTKLFNAESREYAGQPFFQTALARCAAYPNPSAYDHAMVGTRLLPLACALCVVELVDCVATTPRFIAGLSVQEASFGNYGPGRFAWVTRNLRRLPQPLPVRGAQGLWKVPPAMEHGVRGLLVTACQYCGCTEAAACLDGCSWAKPGVCTSCVWKEIP